MDDFDWSRQQGFRVVQAEDIWYQSLAPLMQEVREQMQDHPVYISFDIDSFEFQRTRRVPAQLEPGGLTSHQGLEYSTWHAWAQHYWW